MLSSLMKTAQWWQVHLQNSPDELQLAAETHYDKYQDQWDPQCFRQGAACDQLNAKQMMLRMHDYL